MFPKSPPAHLHRATKNKSKKLKIKQVLAQANVFRERDQIKITLPTPPWERKSKDD